MKFLYEYRTSDNARHSGVIVASDREAAFQRLKAQGIKPGHLTEAPGVLNRLFGKGKRWLTIGVLGVLCLVLCALALDYANQVKVARHKARYAREDRAQIFGDPAVLQKLAHKGWRETFPDAGESFLARHAIPGRVCDCSSAQDSTNDIAAALIARKESPLAILETDPEELKKMKRIINGMKRECADFISPDAPQDAHTFIARCCERCRIEKGIYDNLARDIAVLERKLESDNADRAAIRTAWDKKNATLRSMGLRTIPQPEE